MTKLKAWPASKVESCPLEGLSPYPNNPNKHSPVQIELIKQSMLERGWTIPILIDEDNMILAGHGRVQAAQALVAEGHGQFANAPVVRARGWNDADKLAYVLADNQLTRASDWDVDLLKFNIGKLVALDYEMSLTGFAESELAKFGAWDAQGKDPEAAPEVQQKAVSRRGDIWLLGKHRLACGDCTNTKDVEKALDGAAPHLMVTDPPYGVEYDAAWRGKKLKDGAKRAEGIVNNDKRTDWTAAWKLFDGDVVYHWHGLLHATDTQAALETSGFPIRAQIVWAKDRLVFGRGHYHVQHEPCWYAVRKGANGHWVGDRSQTTLWTIPHLRSETGHSTQKPIECMKRPIENNSKVGDAVYDPFVGSGTTLIAAEMTKRRCIALEIDPLYVDVVVRRWQEYSGKQATLEGGKTFAEVERERKRKGAPKGPRVRPHSGEVSFSGPTVR